MVLAAADLEEAKAAFADATGVAPAVELPAPEELRCTSFFRGSDGSLVPEFDAFAVLPWAEALARVGKNLRRVLGVVNVNNKISGEPLDDDDLRADVLDTGVDAGEGYVDPALMPALLTRERARCAEVVIIP